MPDLALPGCRVRPLGSYLRAMGVLRLVGEQADVGAQGWWDADHFVLRSALDRDDLIAYLVHRYVPTPLLSPWNGGSGFGEKDKIQRRALEAIHRSDDPRLAPYRAAIDAAWAVVNRLRAEGERKGWKPDVWKDRVREACRAELPDGVLPWLDASVVLTGDGRVFPPLLGTGGNDGRFEFSNNFMQRLLQVLALERGRRASGVDDSAGWARQALFGEGGAPLVKAAVGQFDPGGAGTANTAPLGAADALVNPWEWVLLLEGVVLFAGAPARRMSTTGGGRAAVPFTVDASPVGLGSAVGSEDTRGEVWMPVWERPWTLNEVTQMIGEGRVEWNGAQARRSVDVVRAIASAGVDRGVTSFERYAISQRFGRTMLAVPAGRFEVDERDDIPVLRQIDGWLDAVRRSGSDAPGSIGPGLFHVERAMFALARPASTGMERARRLQDVLIAVANLERSVGRATIFRDRAAIGPVSRLGAAAWLPLLDDRSDEFRIAAALALQNDRPGEELRRLLRPVAFNKIRKRWAWTDAAPVPGFTHRPLVDVLAGALRRRAIDVQAAEEHNPLQEGAGGKGLVLAYRRAPVEAPRAALQRFLSGELHDGRIERLLSALLLLDPQPVDLATLETTEPAGPAPAILGLLSPFFVRTAIRPRWRRQDEPVRLLPEARWPALLATRAVGGVAEAALHRLRIAGLDPAVPLGAGSVMAATAPTGVRVAAALLCPIAPRDAAALLEIVAPEPLDATEGASA